MFFCEMDPALALYCFCNIPCDERLCKMRNSGYTETELYFLLCCPKKHWYEKGIFWHRTGGPPNLNS